MPIINTKYKKTVFFQQIRHIKLQIILPSVIAFCLRHSGRGLRKSEKCGGISSKRKTWGAREEKVFSWRPRLFDIEFNSKLLLSFLSSFFWLFFSSSLFRRLLFFSLFWLYCLNFGWLIRFCFRLFVGFLFSFIPWQNTNETLI